MEDLNLLWHLIEQGRKGENKGLSVGLPKLDKIIGGIQPSLSLIHISEPTRH